MLRLLLVVAIFALATYLVIRALERRGGAPLQPRRRPGPKPRPRIVAPDDDEDFLRDLDRKRKHPDDPEQPPAT